MSTEKAAVGPRAEPRGPLSTNAKRGIWAGVVVLVLIALVLGTKVVPSDDPLSEGGKKFNSETFGAEMFPSVQSGVSERAVDAATLATAIAEDPSDAAVEYGLQSSSGTVYSTTFTGVVGEGQSGIYEVDVDGFPDDTLIRLQTGPAINGTELRDATGEFQFGQFTNQIEYQNAAAALNDELKAQVLSQLDAADLTGKTIEVTGAFTLINPASWLVTPVELSVQ